jgi:hypothetical protein
MISPNCARCSHATPHQHDIHDQPRIFACDLNLDCVAPPPRRMPGSQWPRKFRPAEIYQCNHFDRIKPSVKDKDVKKIIQIQASESQYGETCTGSLYALCDDGSLYFMPDPWIKENNGWTRLITPAEQEAADKKGEANG